jgi:hypothetical protein
MCFWIDFIGDYRFANQVLLFQHTFFFEVPLHCVATNRLCNIIKFWTFSTNLGCLWQCYESFVTHYERWCFEPKVWALAPWGCTPFYHIHVLGTLWKPYLPKDSWQPWTKKETMFLNFELKDFTSCMKCKVLKVILSFISFLLVVDKK